MPAPAMLALSAWPLAARQRIRGVFTDIDDTLTTDGAITPDALQALACLQAAGLAVIAVTGRPIGWCEPFARGDPARGVAAWPVDAMVAENGAVAWVPTVRPGDCLQRPVLTKNLCHNTLQPLCHGRKQLSKLYQLGAAERRENLSTLHAVAQRILQEVPHARLAQDSAGRETDIAIDHSEFAHLDADSIAQVVAIMRAQGLNASVSSIHINGWLGGHNKLSGARWIVRQLFGRELDAEADHWVYVGDSTNDQVMFAAFANSVGVANIARFLPELQHKPRYLTQGARGAGFAEVVACLLTR